MTIYPYRQDAQQAKPGEATAYDNVWGSTEEIPTQPPSPLEQAMLAQDKIFVVLTVVLIIWAGILFFLYRTDRKLANLERTVEENIPEPYNDL